VAERPRFVLGLLIALILLAPLGGAALYLAAFRMADCPQKIHEERKAHPDWLWSAWGKYNCFRCQDTGRITILNRWREGDESLEPWEDMEISKITCSGFQKTNPQEALRVTGLVSGNRMTLRLQRQACRVLFDPDRYESVNVRVRNDQGKPGKVEVVLEVKER